VPLFIGFLVDGCHVVFDLDTDDVPASQPGEVVPFDVSFSKCIPDLLAGKEVEPVISRDTYGFLLTIYMPLWDSQGVCQCYAAVDYSMDLLTGYVRSIIRQIILFFLLVIVVIVVVSVLATDKGIDKPMRRLERRAYRDTLTGLQNRTAYYEYNQTLDKRIADGTADFSILMPWQKISAAVGIAAYDRSVDTCTEDVLKRADAAMYQDKVAMKAQRRD